MVLIDAAKGCATGTLDLSKYKADFVVISFYKVPIHKPLRLPMDSEYRLIWYYLLCTDVWIPYWPWSTNCSKW